MKIKSFKGLVSLCLSMLVLFAAIPLNGVFSVFAEGIQLTSSCSFTYAFDNAESGSAEGVLSFDFGDLSKDNVSSLKYYWVDENGSKLSAYSHIIEFGSAYIPEYSTTATHNSIANAVSGYTFLNGTVIPFGARGIIAELVISQNGETVTETVKNGKYIVEAQNYTSLPGVKIQTVDYTTDIGGKELYQLMYFADFHSYYGWADTDPTVDYTNSSTTFVNADGTKGAPQGKAMYAVNKILDSDPKSIGTVDVGDLINDASGGTGSKGYAARGDYKSVLATYYQAGLMDYYNFFAVGNHDLIAAYANDGNNYFIDMLSMANTANKAVSNEKVKGLPDTANSYYYDFYIGEDHYIVLSSPHESPAAFGEEQLAWFKALLAADDASGTRTFVACHESLSGTGVYGGGYLADENELKTILSNYSANHKVYFFTGHTHISYLDNVKNVDIATVGNVSYIGLPYICNTATKYDSQGLQVKVYEDKVVMLGRQLYDNGKYNTDYLPSAMFVAKEDETVEEIPSLITISNAYQLSRIGIDSKMPLDGNYMLVSDIDLSSYENWTPIGYSAGEKAANNTANAVFTGTFDGNGHTISNMYCYIEGQKYIHTGLFGVLKSATVKNLCLKNCVSTAYGGGSTVTSGILAGATISTTSPAPYSTVISNVAVINGKSIATINSGNPCSAGGLVGYSESGVTIKNCYVDAVISGCMGKNLSNVSSQIGAGGLVGHSYKGRVNAENCVIIGSLKYNRDSYEGDIASLYIHTGSVMGFNNRAMSDNTLGSESAVAVNCYYIDTLGVNKDSIRSKNGTAKTAEELSLCDIADLGFEENLWAHNGFTPILKVSGEKEFVLGDINADGKTNVKDLVRFKRYDAGQEKLCALKAVDFDNSKSADAFDLLALRKFILGIEN